MKGELIAPNAALYRAKHDVDRAKTFVFGVMIAADGHIVNVQTIESSDNYIGALLSDNLGNRRFTPARFRGVAVATIRGFKATFAPTGTPEHNLGENGLGVLSR